MSRKKQMYKIPNDEFVKIVEKSFSIAEAIKNCGLIAAGAAYRSFHKRIKELNLDITHFTGQAWSKGKEFGCIHPIEYYLVENCPTIIGTCSLKNRLIKEQIKEYRCECCKLTKWNNQPIPLQLHHINGNRDDSRLENLQILCPNCHSQTDNWTGKKLKKPIIKKLCPDCQAPITAKMKRCKHCAGLRAQKTKINWLSVEELINRLKTTPCSTLAKELGVSDKAIIKHLAVRGIFIRKQKLRKTKQI